MHLVRSLFFLAASHNLSVVGEHIPGAQNGAVDALSRNDSASFLAQVEGAHPSPSTLPPDLLEVLLHHRPDWTSVNWTQLLASISPKVWQSQHSGLTERARIDTCRSAAGQT